MMRDQFSQLIATQLQVGSTDVKQNFDCKTRAMKTQIASDVRRR
jgi:hypothetical protein